ncbi:MAG: MFS transporter [Parabacteroides sp.]|jgi:fucose permease|uniref:Fucose permease n=2 Tax=root TaxID=1 RepID=A0A1T5BJ60_9BACT|nr:MFS transporter [Parabacteroides chartae]MBP7871537.1 MFS transporter [Parabacteroides sp.]MDT3368508.1 MFS transporter [Bacteroidota bacterium]MEA4808868.1 MFS transporter [Macellibacteroides fermentans]HAD02552.1 MFS transporter [Porphyromonadaceae bacterium]MDD3255816.1 MFS transporter [Parabacteroides sp.]
MKHTKSLTLLVPVMFTFFTMGFVDLVGIATNYVKEDFTLSDTMANLLPSMVFLWFLVCSVPTGMLMNKIGRRKTVIISVLVTFLSLLVPLIEYNYSMMLISFALLGIGNAMMQVSLNPLLSNVVSGHLLASSLTLGQFFKAIASFLAPIITAWAVVEFGNWRMLYPIFASISLIAAFWLLFTSVEEQKTEGKTSTFSQCFSLLGNQSILMLFIGIMCHVGIDVGINTTAPKILMERTGMTLADAGYATSLYFLCRTIGCFGGAFILARFAPRKFFLISIVGVALAIGGLLVVDKLVYIYLCIGLIGFGNSNLFSILFSQAFQLQPENSNEVSGLMMMGIFGGAVLPLLMGITSDAIGSQLGAVIILAICTVYLFILYPKLK